MKTSPREWMTAAAAALRDPRQLRAIVKDLRFRVQRRREKRHGDAQLRQLRSLERACSGKQGPDMLVFGDSVMWWTAPTDPDHRHLFEMTRDELGKGTRYEALVGPLYHARIVMAYLSALPRLEAKPKVIVVPITYLTAEDVWLSHPVFSYETVSKELRAIIAGEMERPQALTDPGTEEALDAWDRKPAPSLFGARRTLGELRMITNCVPESKWQKVIRIRHLMDFYNADQLEPDGEGPRLISEMGAMLAELGLPSVAYMAPVNYDVLKATLGDKGIERLKHNVEVTEQAFRSTCGPNGSVVNGTFTSPAKDYIDPLHLTSAGRLRFAHQLAESIRPHLGRGKP